MGFYREEIFAAAYWIYFNTGNRCLGRFIQNTLTDGMTANMLYRSIKIIGELSKEGCKIQNDLQKNNYLEKSSKVMNFFSESCEGKGKNELIQQEGKKYEIAIH